MTTAVWDVTASLLSSSLMQITDFAPFIHGLDHPEGVACGPNGEIYAGGEAGQIYLVEMEGTLRQIGTTGGFVLGLCLDGDSNVYACDLAKHHVAQITPSGEVCIYSSGAPDRPMVTPNYPVFDAAGNLYVSDSGGWHEHNGCVFRVRPGGETVVLSDEIVDFPNGMALHPDGTHLYVVVSQAPAPGVVRIALNGDGSVGSPETVAELPHNVPDGIAFDEDRNLYIACYTPDVIYRVTPGGQLDIVASDWESVTFATPTNIAFCGVDRRMLVVSSLSRWHLTSGQMPIPGARLQYPDLKSGEA